MTVDDEEGDEEMILNLMLNFIIIILFYYDLWRRSFYLNQLIKSLIIRILLIVTVDKHSSSFCPQRCFFAASFVTFASSFIGKQEMIVAWKHPLFA
jgi:hypothetical protein